MLRQSAFALSFAATNDEMLKYVSWTALWTYQSINQSIEVALVAQLLQG